MMYKKEKIIFLLLFLGLVSSFLRPNKPFFSLQVYSSEDLVAACCTRSRGVSTELIAQRFKRSLWRSVTCLNNNGITFIFYSYNTAYNTTNGCNFITYFSAFCGLLPLFLLLEFGRNNRKYAPRIITA